MGTTVETINVEWLIDPQGQIQAKSGQHLASVKQIEAEYEKLGTSVSTNEQKTAAAVEATIQKLREQKIAYEGLGAASKQAFQLTPGADDRLRQAQIYAEQFNRRIDEINQSRAAGIAQQREELNLSAGLLSRIEAIKQAISKIPPSPFSGGQIGLGGAFNVAPTRGGAGFTGPFEQGVPGLSDRGVLARFNAAAQDLDKSEKGADKLKKNLKDAAEHGHNTGRAIFTIEHGLAHIAEIPEARLVGAFARISGVPHEWAIGFAGVAAALVGIHAISETILEAEEKTLKAVEARVAAYNKFLAPTLFSERDKRVNEVQEFLKDYQRTTALTDEQASRIKTVEVTSPDLRARGFTSYKTPPETELPDIDERLRRFYGLPTKEEIKKRLEEDKGFWRGVGEYVPILNTYLKGKEIENKQIALEPPDPQLLLTLKARDEAASLARELEKRKNIIQTTGKSFETGLAGFENIKLIDIDSARQQISTIETMRQRFAALGQQLKAGQIDQEAYQKQTDSLSESLKIILHSEEQLAKQREDAKQLQKQLQKLESEAGQAITVLQQKRVDNPLQKMLLDASKELEGFSRQFEKLPERVSKAATEIGQNVRSSVFRNLLTDQLSGANLQLEIEKAKAGLPGSDLRATQDKAEQDRLSLEKQISEARESGDSERLRQLQFQFETSGKTDVAERLNRDFRQRQLDIAQSALSQAKPDDRRFVLDKIIELTNQTGTLNQEQADVRLRALEERFKIGAFEQDKSRVIIEIIDKSGGKIDSKVYGAAQPAAEPPPTAIQNDPSVYTTGLGLSQNF